MITNTPLLLSMLWAPILSWINISSPLILFGLYYGFLTTLPIGPSQILSIRAFLLEGNLSGIAAVSGLIMGQLIIFLSIYYSPLYIILVKPHTITLLVLPYILFYWYRIKDLLDYQSLRPIISINDARVYKIFLDSFIFQLLNPVLLPNPVLGRLVNLFFFRYSNNFLFVISCFFGWLSGHIFFFNLIKLLLVRIKLDSPILYLLVKRLIYRTFSIIILGCSLLYLGRAPVPFFTKKLSDEFQINQWKTDGLSWLNKPWPTSFFDYRRWNRPLRYIENSRFSNKSAVKKKVSQYFFDISLSDGKKKIAFTSLPSLSIFEKDLKNYLNISKNSFSSDKFYKEWITIKKNRRDNLYNELRNRIKALDTGFLIKDVIEKKTGLSNNEGNNLIKIYDPFLNGSFRGKIIISKSPWLLTENFYELKKNRKILHLSKKDNKLKFWISNRWRELERKNLPLPWEPLNKDARRILISLIHGSKNKKLETNLQQISFSEEQPLINLNKQNNFSDLFVKFDNTFFLDKKITGTSHFNWELILNLSTRQRTLYFDRLEKEKWQTLERSWKNLFSNNFNFAQLKNIISLFIKILHSHKKYRLQEISKEIPRWTSKLKNDKFDVIAIGVTDIRQRKVKNLGYLIKGRDKRRKIVRRFSQQSDFRRKLVKGSMRARRRKILIWKILQLKTHSPFFLRINEKNISFQSSLNILNLINLKDNFTNSLGMKRKIISFSNQKSFTVKKTKTDRLAIANRWDFPLAQWGRSWLLILQSNFRKYLLLPILIIFKNGLRLLLFQTPEWNEDWNEWQKEIHIKCTYDGTEVSEKELPEQWLRDGLQIKIIYPFNLKPWHNIKFKENKKENIYISSNFSNNKEETTNILSDYQLSFYNKKKEKKINYSYLTAWGFQTNAPFGDIKKQPSFWKPIRKELKRKWKKNILLKFRVIYLNFTLINKNPIISSFNKSKELIKLDSQGNKPIKNYVSETKNKYETNYKINNGITNKLPIEIISKSNKKFLPETQIKSKYKNLTNRKKLEKLKYFKSNQIEKITRKNSFDEIQFSNKLKSESKLYLNNKKKLEWKKKLIEIKQKTLKLRRKIIELIKKWPYFIKVIFNEINRNIKKNYVYFIRFNIKLIIKFKKKFNYLKNKELFNKLNITNEKNKISNEYNERIKNLKINFNQQNITLMSQAYVFHKIWQIKEKNKYNFKYLLENWTQFLIIKKKVKKILEKEGIFSFIEFKNLKKKNWKKWLQNFDKYHLSPKIWYRITPEKWRIKVTHHWKEKKKNYFPNFDKQTKSLVLDKQKKLSYKPITNSLLKRIKKLNKRSKYNFLCYSYLDPERKSKMEIFLKSARKKEETLFNKKIQQIFKYRIINNEKNNEKINFNKEKNIFIKSNLISWLIPELIEKKNIYKIERITVPNTSLIKEKNKKNIQNRKSLRDRERHQTIRQWRWKSKNIEKKFKKLGDMASLMTFMQDQENTVSLSVKMREDLSLFRLLFCRDIGINKLTINSEHRLPRVLDDQILMYKVVSTFLKSKKRFKKQFNLKKLNETILRMEIFQNNEKNKFNSISLEDIILLKHRKELKILNLLYLNKNESQEIKFNKEFFEKNKYDYEKQIKLKKIQNKNQILVIKRFLWPSFRLEDLACANRFWFNTNNGSRFTLLRIRMYPLNSN
uniref:Protein TIC 214 n=1 Tax=Tetraphis pellucida TaxID=37420 RepID=A0A060DDH8_9BRYO|nr:Ycf1 [Tetraphis pellucida]AIB08491.1 Ycf1 [Tetraphis pellucida]